MAVGKATAAALAGLLGFALLVVLVGGLATIASTGGGGGGDGSQGLPGVVCAPAAGGPITTVAGFGPQQLSNAALIVAAGTEMGVPQRGQVIAVAAAMQESGLRNLSYGDRDSIGLFQQRANWGPAAVRMDPQSSARLFYQHLLAVPGWQTMPLTAAAQRVQVSALPDAYAHWEGPADQVVGAALHITCTPAPTGGGQPGPPAPGMIPQVPASPLAREVIARAAAQIGTPYAWGGGNAAGPTRGIPDGGVGDAHGDPSKVGFDCSGLMVYAFAGVGIVVPHQTQAIYFIFPVKITDRAAVQPGDMVLESSNGQPSGIDHVGLYLGNGQILDAPQSGQNVRVEHNVWAPGSWWNTHFVAAVRPLATAQAVKTRA
jgi:cell wall-associated NlpC family hydrolase